MEGTEGNIDLAGKIFRLIEFSSENNSLIASDTSLSTPTDHQSSETMGEPTRSFELTGDLGANKVDIMALTNGLSEQMPQLLETSEPERLRKFGKCNLCKSLAWDSAFSESPGVLDAEELSSMIEGADKGKKHLLPGIEEDICTSTESISTLLSENLTVESLENTLFEDIRASIQKSKASNMTNSNCKAASTETDNQDNSAKKVDLTSRKSTMTNVASKTKTVGMQGSGRMIQGSSYPQVTQSVLQNSNSTSSLARLPKVVSRPEPISNKTTKRPSLGVNCDKTETDNAKEAVGGKGIQVPKSTGLAGHRVVAKPAVSSKSSSSASLGAIKEATKSSSSCDSSCTNLSNNIRESPSTSASRKPKTRPVIQPSSGSIPTASSKVSWKKKPPDNSGNSTYLTSSKISPTISPAISSISECSSASLSTSSVNRRLSKPSASFDTSSCRSLDNDTSPVLCLDVQSNDHVSVGIVNQVTGLPCQDINKASMRTGELSRSALKKPSGLRMPSPKIGFFDGAKSVVCTSNGNMQSQSSLPTCLPGMGAGICSPVGSSNKARDGKLPPGTKKVSGALRGVKSNTTSSDVHNETGTISCSNPVWSSNKAIEKLQPGKTVIRSRNTKTESQKSTSSKPFQEASSVSHGISPEDREEKGGVSCLEDEDLKTGKPDRIEHATVPALEAEKDENLGDSKNSVNLLVQRNAEIDEINTAPVKARYL